MRYSFLHYLRCPHCHGELTVLTHTESACDMGKAILKPFARTSPAGAGVGPLPAAPVATDVVSGDPGEVAAAAGLRTGLMSPEGVC
jgi:uncharacterized protein YbaR (Trm112 family)